MTAAASSSSTVAFVFRRRYSDKQVADQTTRDHPTYARIAKREGLGGQDFVYGVVTGDPQGVGNTFSSAQDADETLKGEQFVASDVQKYAYMTIDGPSMLRNQANQGKIIDLVTRTIDGGLKSLGYEMAFDLFRDGTGRRGQRASIVGNVVTLTNGRDVDNFKRGMKLIASSNANGSAPRSGTAKVVKLDRQGKKITLDDQSTIVNFSDNDFLFRAGTAQNSLNGMGACTPLTAPTAGVLFRNVERTNDLEMLAGTRIDDPTRFPEEMIGDLAVQLSLVGKRVERATVYPTAFQSIVKRLGAKVNYENPEGGTAKVGFQELTIFAGGYAVRVTADPDIVPTEVRVWSEDAHELVYLGDSIVHLIRDDGKIRQRQTGNDGFEVRARALADYLQPDPAAHGVGTFQA